MIRLSKEDILQDKNIIKNLKDSVFIYPTDTIYGIGCNAQIKESVEIIRRLKQRKDQPFSVCAPGKDWIKKNCEVSSEANAWIDRLPGPYTLILKLLNTRCVAPNITPFETIGVRIPDHWFMQIVKKMGVPIVTTSVNVSGQPPMTSIEDMDQVFKEVDFLIYEGKKQQKPSKIVNLIDGRITER